MNVTKFVLEHVTKLKVFYDKGYEYYGMVITLISLSILIGVWLPYIQEGFALLGIYVSKIMLSIVLTLSMFIFVLIFFIIVGWFLYKKSIPQMEWVYRDLQHPIYVMSMMSYRRLYSMLDELSMSLDVCLKAMERNKEFKLTGDERKYVKDFSDNWKKIKEDFPLKLQVGDKVIIDADTITYEEMKELVRKARSIR
jgi:ABC-type multidrug transport system fused ATPase/permease subunit